MGRYIFTIVASIIYGKMAYEAIINGRINTFIFFESNVTKKMKISILLLRLMFTISIIIVAFFGFAEEKLNHIAFAIFIGEVIVFVIYLITVLILSIFIRKKMVSNSLMEFMRNNPECIDFSDVRILNAFIMEYRNVGENEAKKAMLKFHKKQ